jgi:hypothetical protein
MEEELFRLAMGEGFSFPDSTSEADRQYIIAERGRAMMRSVAELMDGAGSADLNSSYVFNVKGKQPAKYATSADAWNAYQTEVKAWVPELSRIAEAKGVEVELPKTGKFTQEDVSSKYDAGKRAGHYFKNSSKVKQVERTPEMRDFQKASYYLNRARYNQNNGVEPGLLDSMKGAVGMETETNPKKDVQKYLTQMHMALDKGKKSGKVSEDAYERAKADISAQSKALNESKSPEQITAVADNLDSEWHYSFTGNYLVQSVPELSKIEQEVKPAPAPAPTEPVAPAATTGKKSPPTAPKVVKKVEAKEMVGRVSPSTGKWEWFDANSPEGKQIGAQQEFPENPDANTPTEVPTVTPAARYVVDGKEMTEEEFNALNEEISAAKAEEEAKANAPKSKDELSTSLAQAMEAMERGDQEGAILQAASLFQDLGGIFSGIIKGNEELPDYTPSRYLKQMVDYSRKLTETGIPENEEEQMRGEARRGLDFQAGVIRKVAGGNAGAILGNTTMAVREYNDALAKIEQADVNAKMAALPSHLSALEKMEQAHLLRFELRYQEKLAERNAADKLVSTSMSNMHKGVQYQQAFGKGSVNRVLAYATLAEQQRRAEEMELAQEQLTENLAGEVTTSDMVKKAKAYQAQSASEAQMNPTTQTGAMMNR